MLNQGEEVVRASQKAIKKITEMLSNQASTAVEEALGNEKDENQVEKTNWNEYTKPALTLLKLISVRFTIYIAFNSGSNLLFNLLETFLPAS